MGLAIARTIIQALGGTVLLRNVAGGGLEAVVRLPVGAVESLSGELIIFWGTHRRDDPPNPSRSCVAARGLN